MTNIGNSSFSFNSKNVYLNRRVNVENISDTKLYEHLQNNVQWLGGQVGDKITSEHLTNFISKIDGGGDLDNRDGVITEQEIQKWLDVNGHGDKFGTTFDILNVLKNALTFTPEQSEKVDETITELSFDKSNIQLSDAKNALYDHLAKNVQWLGGKVGDELSSEHLVNFIAKIDGGNGVITRAEVESWVKNQGFGDKFGSVDNIMTMLNELVSNSGIAEAESDNIFANYLGNVKHEGEYSSLKFDKSNIQLSDAKNALYDHLAKNVQWLGGKVGDELSSEHLANFIAKIDGGNGEITRQEVENWLINQGHGDKFGSVDDFLVMLNELVASEAQLVSSSEGLTVKPEDISDEEIAKWLQDNNHGDKFGDIQTIKETFAEILNSGLLEVDESKHIDYRLMNLSDNAKALLRHLENNTYFLEGKKGDLLTSKHLKDFFMAHVNNNLPVSEEEVPDIDPEDGGIEDEKPGYVDPNAPNDNNSKTTGPSLKRSAWAAPQITISSFGLNTTRRYR